MDRRLRRRRPVDRASAEALAGDVEAGGDVEHRVTERERERGESD